MDKNQGEIMQKENIRNMDLLLSMAFERAEANDFDAVMYGAWKLIDEAVITKPEYLTLIDHIDVLNNSNKLTCPDIYLKTF